MEKLKNFVKDKGNSRKKGLYDICVFQTTDAANTKRLSQNLGGHEDLAKDRHDDFESRMDAYESEKAAAEARV